MPITDNAQNNSQDDASKIATPRSELSRPGPRLLIIRFSSFGDIVQATSIPSAFRQQFPGAEVHWLVRADFRTLLDSQKEISQVIPFERKESALKLMQLAWKLSKRNYDYVYDAHSNVRSSLVMTVFRIHALFRILSLKPATHFAHRSKERLKRFLFFSLRLRPKSWPNPYRGAESFLWPIKKWGIAQTVPAGPVFTAVGQLSPEVEDSLKLLPRPWVAIGASAAWPMKRWPETHWAQLMANERNLSFILLGGPEDFFLQKMRESLISTHPTQAQRVLNLAGQLNLAQSAVVISASDLIIANDTGLLHVADQMAKPTIALIGPTAFGYPSHASSTTLEIELPCKPCSKDGRGKCVNSIYQKCLIEISPERVTRVAIEKLSHLEAFAGADVDAQTQATEKNTP